MVKQTKKHPDSVYLYSVPVKTSRNQTSLSACVVITRCVYVQVMGHHNARLDPLEISCVNFDDVPVNTGFQDVGENAGTERTDKLLPACCVNDALPTPPPFYFSPSSSNPSVFKLCPSFLVFVSDLVSMFLFWRSSFSISFLSSTHPASHPHLLRDLLFLHLVSSSSSFFLHPLLPYVPSCPPPPPPTPAVLGGLCAVVTPCRSEGTMWPSWTPSASWTPIWTRVSPMTLSPPPTSWVRS